MLNRVKAWVRLNLTRQFNLQSNIRVLPHNHPNQFVVYTKQDRGSWVRLYTGPLNEGLMTRVGWGRRETFGEAVKRLVETFKRAVRRKLGRV